MELRIPVFFHTYNPIPYIMQLWLVGSLSPRVISTVSNIIKFKKSYESQNAMEREREVVASLVYCVLVCLVWCDFVLPESCSPPSGPHDVGRPSAAIIGWFGMASLVLFAFAPECIFCFAPSYLLCCWPIDLLLVYFILFGVVSVICANGICEPCTLFSDYVQQSMLNFCVA